MNDFSTWQGIELVVVLFSSFLISANIYGHVFGGSSPGFGTWITLMSGLGAFSLTLYLSQAAGLDAWAFIPSLIVSALVFQVCIWLGLHDTWSEDRHPSMVQVKRWVAGLIAGTIVTSLAIVQLSEPV